LLHGLRTEEEPEGLAHARRPADDMVLIRGGTFRMGSDKHYPEEAPVHRVAVDAFWIDRTPVTNRQFKEFVKATGHVTFAEVPPDPKDYPGALPHMLYAGSLVFSPPTHRVDLRDWSQWWTFLRGRGLAPPLRTEEQHPRARRSSSRARGVCRRTGLRQVGWQGSAD
jgi:formylglycine-generating enzyme required for sulfatase activity